MPPLIITKVKVFSKISIILVGPLVEELFFAASLTYRNKKAKKTNGRTLRFNSTST